MSIEEWEGYPQVEMFAPWERKPQPTLLSDEEQKRIDRAVDAALNARSGYGHGPVRRLSAAEIAELAGEITPIEKVRVLPFIGFHDRRMLEGGM